VTDAGNPQLCGLHQFHEYVNVIGCVPAHVPVVPLTIEPAVVEPEIVGKDELVGATSAAPAELAPASTNATAKLIDNSRTN
jgi:hypothetical protein